MKLFFWGLLDSPHNVAEFTFYYFFVLTQFDLDKVHSAKVQSESVLHRNLTKFHYIFLKTRQIYLPMG